MAFTYGFYNSKNKDRRYNADQMSQLFDGILNDGVFNKVGELMMVVPGTGLQVLVKSGRAWFNSTWSYNDAAYPLNLSTPDVAVPRIDAVVLEVDHTETVRRNRLLVVKGIASSNPEKPTLTNTNLIHQHPLAYVTLRAGAESISSGDIEIMVGKDECPFVTGILETASLEDLFTAWEEQFTTWFDDVKSQLEGDVATNLLNMINERVKIADKASTSEVSAGTNDTKWVTPRGIAAVAGKVKDSASNSLITTRSLFIDYINEARYYKSIGSNIDMDDDYWVQTSTYLYCLHLSSTSERNPTVDVYRFYKTSTKNVSTRIASLALTTTSSSGESYNIFSILSPYNCAFLKKMRNLNIAFDTARSAISITSDDYPYITEKYQGYIRFSSSTATVYVARRGNLASTNTYTNFTATLSGSYFRFIGFYNDVLWLGSVLNTTEYHIHKIDVANKTFQANIAVLNSVGHTSNVSLTGVEVKFIPLYYSGNTAFIFPAYSRSGKSNVISNKILTVSLVSGLTNWDSITSFSESDISIAYRYVGSKGSYSYVLSSNIVDSDMPNLAHLLKFNESTLSISKSYVKNLTLSSDTSYRTITISLPDVRSGAPSKFTNGITENLFYLSPSHFIDVELSEFYAIDNRRINASGYVAPILIGDNFTSTYTYYFYGSTTFSGDTSSYHVGYGGPPRFIIQKT